MTSDRWRLTARAAVLASGALVIGLGAACSDDEGPGAQQDAGLADTATADAGGDAVGADAGGHSDAVVGEDAALDTGIGGDAGSDAGSDAGGDAGSDAGPTGNASVTSIDPIATGGAAFSTPLDSTPDPDAKTIYFTAQSDGTPGVFRVAVAGGAVTPLAVGAPLSAPLGIAVAPSGTLLFVADPAAEEGDVVGRIFTLSTEGGAPATLAGTEGTLARGVDVVPAPGGDLLFFTGTAPGTSEPAVMRMPAAGGAVTVLAKGGALSDPSGVAATSSGETVYVTDTSASNGRGAVFAVTEAGVESTIVKDIGVGYPAGIALSLDESVLLVSGIDSTTGSDVVYRVELATGAVQHLTEGISANVDAGGVHRARNKDTYSWADLSAGSGGAVYLVKTLGSD